MLPWQWLQKREKLELAMEILVYNVDLWPVINLFIIDIHTYKQVLPSMTVAESAEK